MFKFLCSYDNNPTHHQPSHQSKSHQTLISNENCSTLHVLFSSKNASLHEPSSFSRANGNLKWQKAMQDELSALEQNNTWIFKQLPVRKFVIDCRWFYKSKFKSDGEIE